MSTTANEPTIHETAIVDDGASIGPGSRVWHFVHVCGGAVIGRGCSLGQNVFVGNKVVIGDNVKIQNNVSVYDNVTLEAYFTRSFYKHMLRKPVGRGPMELNDSVVVGDPSI